MQGTERKVRFRQCSVLTGTSSDVSVFYSLWLDLKSFPFKVTFRYKYRFCFHIIVFSSFINRNKSQVLLFPKINSILNQSWSPFFRAHTFQIIIQLMNVGPFFSLCDLVTPIRRFPSNCISLHSYFASREMNLILINFINKIHP